jgi:hypothetical protein
LSPARSTMWRRSPIGPDPLHKAGRLVAPGPEDGNRGGVDVRSSPLTGSSGVDRIRSRPCSVAPGSSGLTCSTGTRRPRSFLPNDSACTSGRCTTARCATRCPRCTCTPTRPSWLGSRRGLRGPHDRVLESADRLLAVCTRPTSPPRSPTLRYAQRYRLDQPVHLHDVGVAAGERVADQSEGVGDDRVTHAATTTWWSYGSWKLTPPGRAQHERRRRLGHGVGRSEVSGFTSWPVSGPAGGGPGPDGCGAVGSGDGSG